MAEDVEGLQALLKSMERLPLVVQRVWITRALRAAGEVIKNRIEAFAPDDPMTRGSRIRDNIVINVVDQTASGARALIGPSKKGFMGIFAELGTARQVARPFIGPAFDQTVDEAYNILVKELGDGIESEFMKGTL